MVSVTFRILRYIYAALKNLEFCKCTCTSTQLCRAPWRSFPLGIRNFTELLVNQCHSCYHILSSVVKQQRASSVSCQNPKGFGTLAAHSGTHLKLSDLEGSFLCDINIRFFCVTISNIWQRQRGAEKKLNAKSRIQDLFPKVGKTAHS